MGLCNKVEHGLTTGGLALRYVLPHMPVEASLPGSTTAHACKVSAILFVMGKVNIPMLMNKGMVKCALIHIVISTKQQRISENTRP